jgi:hypothetical protein
MAFAGAAVSSCAIATGDKRKNDKAIATRSTHERFHKMVIEFFVCAIFFFPDGVFPIAIYVVRSRHNLIKVRRI